MTRAMLVGLAVLVCCPSTGADVWAPFPDELITKRFRFGDTVIVHEIDGTKGGTAPPHYVTIYAGDTLVARYKNVGFEHLYASKDKRYFVGLSNTGLTTTAFVVFDRDGHLIREVKHRYLPDEVYTEESTTLIKKWAEWQRPVKFKIKEGYLEGVIVWGTRFKRYDLLAWDLGLNEDDGDEPPARSRHVGEASIALRTAVFVESSCRSHAGAARTPS